MSVKEVIRRLEEQDVKKKSRKEQLEETVANIYDKALTKLDNTYAAGYAEARITQAALLEDLRKSGVVKLLEEMTGPIKPIVYIEDDDSPEFRRKLGDMMIESFHGVEQHFKGKWSAFARQPNQKIDGTPDDTLIIEVTRVKTEQMMPNMSPSRPQPVLRVTLEYGTDKHMVIKGEKETFRGKMYPKDLPVYERAIAEAFFKPQFSW